MGLFDERIAYKPFEYPEYYNEGWFCTWFQKTNQVITTALVAQLDRATDF